MIYDFDYDYDHDYKKAVLSSKSLVNISSWGKFNEHESCELFLRKYVKDYIPQVFISSRRQLVGIMPTGILIAIDGKILEYLALSIIDFEDLAIRRKSRIRCNVNGMLSV